MLTSSLHQKHTDIHCTCSSVKKNDGLLFAFMIF